MTEQEKTDANRLKLYFPYRRVWLAVRGNERVLVCKPDARAANKLVREGFEVAEIKFS